MATEAQTCEPQKLYYNFVSRRSQDKRGAAAMIGLIVNEDGAGGDLQPDAGIDAGQILLRDPPIGRARAAVYRSFEREEGMSASEKPIVKPPTAGELAALTQTAIAEGRHCPIEQWRARCDGCGNWVSSIYHTTEGSRRRLCPECADLIGQGPNAFQQRQQQLARLYAPTEVTGI
jgi:hypothetical protein